MIGIIGGTGLYTLFDHGRETLIDTPYGQPSGPITVATVGDRQVAFLARHGRDHQYPAHRVPYRANLWALHQLGCSHILAPCATGSLSPQLDPGALVVPDQLIDRTTARERTFFDDRAAHINFAEPYCPHLRQALIRAARKQQERLVNGATMVVIDGPRFSTIAESRWHQSIGATLVNMTGAPEAALARELQLCYATLAVVTDRDAGSTGDRSVTQLEVLQAFARNINRLKTLLIATVEQIDETCACSCQSALADLDAAAAPRLAS